ncbi:MAG: response regulator, partial [Woeseiaceae bacterium]
MPSILLVDDDADIRLLLRKLLVDEGFVVHTAHDGRHALHLLEKIDPPSVILLDYRMPVMDGKHCLAAIRRNTRLQRIPVVLLSAW